jgi:hypothetical protein
MNIQTLSIVVPTKGCVNNCKFCVSRMHENLYENRFDEFQMKKRIKWAVMNGINTCIITGTGEPFQNYHFLGRLADIFKEMGHPFPNVEFQTTGVMLTDKTECAKWQTKHKDGTTVEGPGYYYHNIIILKELGVNTISLSISDVHDEKNIEITGIPEKLQFNLKEHCKFILDNGFNLRISLNLLDTYEYVTPEDIILRCKVLGANQITFRRMYCPKKGYTPQSDWVKEHSCSEKKIKEIKEYIQGKAVNGHQDGNGRLLYQLPFGAFVYSVHDMSVVMDDNCMGKEEYLSLKFVVLRENGKLYSQWDDEGSLIF